MKYAVGNGLRPSRGRQCLRTFVRDPGSSASRKAAMPATVGLHGLADGEPVIPA
jgi:hypothetical protein